MYNVYTCWHYIVINSYSSFSSVRVFSKIAKASESWHGLNKIGEKEKKEEKWSVPKNNAFVGHMDWEGGGEMQFFFNRFAYLSL